MTDSLSVKDGVTEWIDKINAILDLQNVDGAFVNSDSSWSNTNFTLSRGKFVPVQKFLTFQGLH